MLSVYYGSDQVKARQQAHFAIDELLKPGTELTRLEAGSYESGQLLSVCSAVSLFSPTAVYLLELSEEGMFFEEFMAQLDDLSQSTHHFVAILAEPSAALKKKIGAVASVIEEFQIAATQGFNPFKMADALATKDKKNLWLLLQEARQNGLVAEEIIGTLWWQLKAMRLAAVTKSATEAGMKDYPYKKAKSALHTFPVEVVEKKSRALLTLYHEGHRGMRDIDLALEEWVLTL
jgi:DNA polymerase III delta subunit